MTSKKKATPEIVEVNTDAPRQGPVGELPSHQREDEVIAAYEHALPEAPAKKGKK